MRSLIIGFPLVLGVIATQCAAAGTSAPQSSPMLINAAATGELSDLLKKLDAAPIAKVVAAQCEEEGENCTSTAQCCSGLECTGAPQATCTPAD
jgi:hypothetical protein